LSVNHPPEAIYWLWLQRCLGAASRVMMTVMQSELGARGIYESTSDELWRSGLFSLKTIKAFNDRSLEREKRILARCEELDISVTFPGDAAYPRPLLDLPDLPAVLYYQGRLTEMISRPCIALVGTRKATDYGMEAARELAARLSRAGMTVVSGCARGIDTASHKGALESINGGTIAVLGCGIDYRYNMANEELRRTIARLGALISEYPPGTDSSPYHFPVRNRIISGLSLGTVVVEADSRSGSLITANLAAEQGRDVFVVPSGLNSPNSSGVNRLGNDGAYTVRSPMDVLKHYVRMFPMHLSLDGADRELMFGNEPKRMEPVRRKSEPEPVSAVRETEQSKLPEYISDEARGLYEFLRMQPVFLDDLARQAGVLPSEAMNLLMELELCGCAKAHPGGRYSLN